MTVTKKRKPKLTERQMREVVYRKVATEEEA